MDMNEYGPLTHVLLKQPSAAFVDEGTIAAQWEELHYTAPPDLSRAIREYDRFVELLRTSGARVDFLPRDTRTTLDSIYVRDAALVSPRGVIVCSMGKRQRAAEPAAQEDALRRLVPELPVAGRIEPPGHIEGGDVVWLDGRTVAVGRGYRTNDEGIRQLRAMLGDAIDVIAVPLPHWRGETDVMHLMSLISPVDHDLAVVYSPLLPVPFREQLLERGLRLIDVPDEEFDSMATNVLALAPRQCVMLTGNPRTRAALERAGASVTEYDGLEISVKGAGGPTCLTRPLGRLSADARSSGSSGPKNSPPAPSPP
jgi:N-dimethylarginine dimethylaminohydrolase